MTTEAREQRLRKALAYSALWLMFQGTLSLLLSEHVASWLGLRYDLFTAPYVRSSGLAQLVLGLYLQRAVPDPRRQSLAVDALLLLLLGSVILTLQARVSTRWLSYYEWAQAVIDLGLAAVLLTNRFRSGELGQDAPGLAIDARELARQTRAWIKGRGPRPQLLMDGEGAEPEPAPAKPSSTAAAPAPPAPVAPAPGTPPIAPGAVPPPPAPPGVEKGDRPKSEALPRMD